MGMPPSRSVDLSKLGVALVAGAAVVYAIRNARREAVVLDGHCASPEINQEVEYAVQMSARILAIAMSRHANFFEQKTEAFTTGVTQEDIQM